MQKFGDELCFSTRRLHLHILEQGHVAAGLSLNSALSSSADKSMALIIFF